MTRDAIAGASKIFTASDYGRIGGASAERHEKRSCYEEHANTEHVYFPAC